MAQSLNTPDVLTQPIAQNGDKNTIPNTNDQSLGEMSQSTGFPAICSTPITDGGKAPRRGDFNGAFNLISQQHFFFQNGGMNTFRQDVSNAIGGYPLNARLWYTDSNNESVIVRSLIQNNTYNFNSNPSYIDGVHWVVEIESGSKVGCIMAYAGNTAPTGWLLCDGSAISRTNYARLFSVIGTTYGSGNGSTTFNLPNGNLPTAGNKNVVTTQNNVLSGAHYYLRWLMSSDGSAPTVTKHLGVIKDTGRTWMSNESMSTGSVGTVFPSNLVASLTDGTVYKAIIKY